MQYLTDNFYNKPLAATSSVYKGMAIGFPILAGVLIFGAQLLRQLQPAESVSGIVIISIGLVFAIWGMVSHAGLSKSRRTFWPLLVHLLLLTIILCNVIVQFSGDKEPHIVRTLVKFYELGVIGLVVAAIGEVTKRVLIFARDLDQITVVVTSVEYEFDQRARSEVLVVAYRGSTDEVCTPLRLVKHDHFEKVAPGSNLRITFRSYPDNTRQIAKIEILGGDTAVSS